MVLGSRAQHGRPADVYVFYRLGERAPGLCDGAFEGIEVDCDEVDADDAVRLHRGAVHVPSPEDAAVDLRMQRLDPPIHHLGEAGDGGDLGGGDPGLEQRAPRAAGRDYLRAAGDERLRQRHDSGLVRNAQERPAHGAAFVPHHMTAKA